MCERSFVLLLQLDQQWRKAFIGKVYSILGIQLFVTVVINALMMFFGGTEFVIWARTRGAWAYYLSIIGTIITLCFTFCFRQKSPHNLVFLGLFTLCESYAIGMARLHPTLLHPTLRPPLAPTCPVGGPLADLRGLRSEWHDGARDRGVCDRLGDLRRPHALHNAVKDQL